MKNIIKDKEKEEKKESSRRQTEKNSEKCPEIEMGNVELEFKDSIKEFSYSRKSAFSAAEFSVHSENIPDEADDEFFFEQDNNNSLIEKIEEKIQSDILKEESKRQKKEMELFFRTVKLNEFERRSHGETRKTIDNDLPKKVSIVDVKCHRSEDVKIIGGNEGNEYKITINNIATNENYEIEDMNDLVEDFDQNDSRNDSQSHDISQATKKVNKTDDCSFHTVTKKMGFEPIK